MFKRVLLAIIFLLSLGWIGYIGFDLFQNSNEYSQSYIFGNQDERLLIVNKPDEVDFTQIDHFSESPLLAFICALNHPLYQTGYFSAKRSHFMLEGKQNWTPENIKTLFSNTEISVTNITNDTFKLGDYIGRFRKSKLYVWEKAIQPNSSPTNEIFYDKKASASLIKFGATEFQQVADIYFKKNGKVNYITRNDQISAGSQIDDETLFSGYISAKIKSYHFFEQEYLKTTDSIYIKSPMSQWCQNGYVEVSYGKETLLVSDYIGGQDPILILNDVKQTQNLQQFNIQLTQNFPKNNRNYFIKYLDDLVVITYNEETCDQFIADYKLGNTIALNDKKRMTIFGNLPKLVSERFYTADSHYSKAVYKGFLLETRLGSEVSETNSIPAESIAMPCNIDIKDFAVLEGIGNAVVLGTNGEIISFEQGKEKWQKNIGEEAIGNLQVIDLHGNDQDFILVNTEEEIHVMDRKGSEVSGFPIKLEHPAINEVKFYRWKNKSYFLIANENNEVVHFDSQGRELHIFNPEVLPSKQIDIWSSQSKLFAGFLNGTSFEMYNLKTQQSHRTFTLNALGKSAKIRNQLLHFTINNDVLSMFDQKGIRSDFQTYPNGTVYSIHNQINNPTVIVRSNNEIHFINQQGIPFGKIRLPFNEIDYVSYNTLNSGETVIGIIDGLENNVYLYRIDGNQLYKKSFEGKSKVIVLSEGTGLKITTIVDQYLIQYLRT